MNKYVQIWLSDWVFWWLKIHINAAAAIIAIMKMKNEKDCKCIRDSVWNVNEQENDNDGKLSYSTVQVRISEWMFSCQHEVFNFSTVLMKQFAKTNESRS